MEYVTELTLDVNLHKELPTVRVKQGDASTRKLLINLKKDGNVFIPDGGSSVLFRCEKPDGHAVLLDSRYQDSELGRYLVVNNGDGTISVELVAQVTVVSGSCRCDICLLKNEEVLSSIPFVIEVKRSPNTAILSESSDDRRSLIYTSDIADGAVTEEKLSSDLIEKIDGGGGGGTSDYTALSNKPQINGVTLSGNKTSQQLGIVDNYYATYGTTTNAQINTALAAGKLVICKGVPHADNLVHCFNATLTSMTTHYFTGIGNGGEAVVATCANNFWSYSSTPIPIVASDIGAIEAPASASVGDFLCYTANGWDAVTVPSAAGVSF